MRRPLKSLAIVLSASLFMISGCGLFNSSSDNSNTPIANNEVKTISVENYSVTGTTTIKFDRPPQQVVVAGLEETEMVLAFCDPENIKAVYGYNNLEDFLKPQYKDKLKEVTVLQRGQINTENIMAMQPDLLIAEQCSFQPSSLRSTKIWNDRGIKTYVPINTNSPAKHLIPEDIETEYQYISDFGVMFNKRELSNKFIEDAKNTMAFFQSYKENANGNAPTVMIVEQFSKEIASYDKSKLGGKIVTALGGNIPETAPLIGKEELRAIDPDVLFIVCSDADHGKCKQRLCDNPLFQELKAVRNGRVYSLELETIYGPGIRIKDGIEKIGLSLYPETKEEYLKTQENTINPSYDSWFTS